MIKWTRTSKLSMKISLSAGSGVRRAFGEPSWWQASIAFVKLDLRGYLEYSNLHRRALGRCGSFIRDTVYPVHCRIRRCFSKPAGWSSWTAPCRGLLRILVKVKVNAKLEANPTTSLVGDAGHQVHTVPHTWRVQCKSTEFLRA
jgi:hypothetical protein